MASVTTYPSVGYPGSAALDRFLETAIRRGVYILSTALVLIGLPVWLTLATCVPAGSSDSGLRFNPDANLTIERIFNETRRNSVAPQ